MDINDFIELEELLLKHASTLDSLQLIICPKSSRYRDKRQPIRLNLPIFPKLRHLNIGWDTELKNWTELAWYDCQNHDNIRRYWATTTYHEVRLSFPSAARGILYEEHFPSLKSLTLLPYPTGYPSLELGSNQEWASVDQVMAKIGLLYEMFFPSIAQNFGQPQVVRSVAVLDILTQVPINGGGTQPLFSQTAVARIADMFPNLRDKHWAKKACVEQVTD